MPKDLYLDENSEQLVTTPPLPEMAKNTALDTPMVAAQILAAAVVRTSVPTNQRDRNELINTAFNFAEDFIKETERRGYNVRR